LEELMEGGVVSAEFDGDKLITGGDVGDAVLGEDVSAALRITEGGQAVDDLLLEVGHAKNP
jgi:hypothetical protein